MQKRADIQTRIATAVRILPTQQELADMVAHLEEQTKRSEKHVPKLAETIKSMLKMTKCAHEFRKSHDAILETLKKTSLEIENQRVAEDAHEVHE